MGIRTVTPYVALNTRSGTPQMRRYRGATFTLFGATFGTADTGGGNYDQPVNRVVWWNGNQYAAVGNQIYQSVDGSASWSSVYTISDISSSTALKSGLNSVSINGIVYLTLFYATSGGLLRGIRTTNGTTWTTTSTGGVGTGSFTNDTVFQNKVVCLSTTSSYLHYYDLDTNTVGSLYIAGYGSSINSTLCIFNEKLYMLMTNSSGQRQLVIVTLPTLNIVATLGTFNNIDGAENMPGLLVDNGNLYAFILKTSTSTGWGCWQITTAHTVTDITSSVIPAAMMGSLTNSRVRTWVDGNWSPGANPPKYLMYSINGTFATNFTLYQWQGPSSQLFAVNTDGQQGDAMTVTKDISGHGVFLFGAPQNPIVGWQILSNGNMQLSFKVVGVPGTVVHGRFFYDSGGPDPYAVNIATLANPSTGSLNAATTAILNIVVEDYILPIGDTSTHTVEWVVPSGLEDKEFSIVMDTFL